MKLSQTLKLQIIRAILDDLPPNGIVEKARALILADVVAKLPPPVRALWDDPELRPWVRTQFGGAGDIRRFCADVPCQLLQEGFIPVSDETRKELDALAKQLDAANETIVSLREHLVEALQPLGTRAELLRTFPQFEKYLPPAPARRDRSVPVPINTSEALNKRLANAGWKP